MAAARPPYEPADRVIVTLALGVGFAGGIYGIGGSLLSPILTGYGVPLSKVAPAELVSTFITSLVGAATFAVLAVLVPGTTSRPTGRSASPLVWVDCSAMPLHDCNR